MSVNVCQLTTVTDFYRRGLAKIPHGPAQPTSHKHQAPTAEHHPPTKMVSSLEASPMISTAITVMAVQTPYPAVSDPYRA